MRRPPMRMIRAAQRRQVHFCQRPAPARRKIQSAAAAAMKARATMGFMATRPGAIDLAVSILKSQPIMTRRGTMVGMARTNLKVRRGCERGTARALPAGPVGKTVLRRPPDTTPLFPDPPARGCDDQGIPAGPDLYVSAGFWGGLSCK